MRAIFVLHWLITAATLSLLVTTVSGQNLFSLQNSAVQHRLDRSVGVFVDSSHAALITEIVSPDFQKNFKQSEGNLTFGYLKAPIWLKVVTKNESRSEWYLEIPAPFLEYIDFYQFDHGTWDHSQAGYFRSQEVRRVSHTGHVLPLLFANDSVSTVYIRIAGSSPKTFPLYVVTKEAFVQKIRYEDVGYGVFFGILFVMFFYNLFIYFTLRQTNYLLYIFTIVCTFTIFAAASGYAGKFLWPANPELNYYFGRLTLGLLVIFLSIFTIRFLEVKQYSLVMYYILVGLIPLGVVANILIVTNVLSSAGNNLISLSTVVYMATGIVCRVKGNRTATYFIAAWTIYLFGGLLLTLRNSGVLDFNFWTTHFVEVGAALETTIIAFALADQYRRIKKEKEDAQALALTLQQEAREKLEMMVRERTAQLSTAYEELHATLETNKLQTKVIENKNAELDAFFYRISHDLKGPISSLLGLSFLARIDIKDEQAQVYLEKQHTQVERLNTIITGLINLTKLNNTDLQKEKIDFDNLIDGCILSFNTLSNFTKITFRKAVASNIEFRTEWTLMNAVIQNLIENAIKYAGENSPFVKITVNVKKNDVVIEVEDNGQGIPQEHLPRIFEMFYRATHNTAGTGLGLYILKRSLDRLKGTIDIKSQVGIGSTFTVRLPLIPE
jgi:signal transduction histidine kinase